MHLLKQKISSFFGISSKNHYPDTKRRFQGKVFCVGFNKTGTTSFEQALKGFGYRLGNQQVAEMLLEDWHKRNFDRLIRFCYTAEAFQDIPFSLPETYRYLDEAFADAKFILTIRDSREQWFESLTKFHTKLFSSDKRRPPDESDLQNAAYRYKGFAMDIAQWVYGYPAIPLYDYDYYTSIHEQHNKSVIDHFKDRPGQLLVLNVSEPNAYQKLAAFLNITVPDDIRFPWKNKTINQ